MKIHSQLTNNFHQISNLAYHDVQLHLSKKNSLVFIKSDKDLTEIINKVFRSLERLKFFS